MTNGDAGSQSDQAAQDDQQSGQPAQDAGQPAQDDAQPAQPAPEGEQAEQPTPVLCGSGTTITIQCGGTPLQFHPGAIHPGVMAPEKVDASDAVDGQVLTASGGMAAWADASAAPPPGSGMPFFGNVVPDGWLLCNGAEVNRTTYAALFAAIGTTYGVGNGNTTFNLPDLRGRFPLGLDNMGGTSADVVTATEADSLGTAAGQELLTLQESELPSHDHALLERNTGTPETDPDAGFRSKRGQRSDFWTVDLEQESWSSGQEYGRYVRYADTVARNKVYDKPNHNDWLPLAPFGNDDQDSHNNMPPYLSLNYIIKT